MITLSVSGDSILFQFDESSHYLFNGEITVPKNSLSLLIDKSDMVTFYKAGSNDIFISSNIAEYGMTKAQLEAWYEENMVSASEGMTPEEVEELIDDALLNYYDEDEIDSALALKQDVSGMTAYTTTAVTDALNTIVTAHTADTSIHVTSAEKTTWNSAATDASAAVSALGGLSLVKLTQAQYDALATKDPMILYIIVD